MKVLVTCDDFWHPGEIIERGLKPLAEKGIEFDIMKAPRDILTKELLKGDDVIINAKSDCFASYNSAPWFDTELPTMVMPNDFKEYIEEGHGFIALHAGNCYTRKSQSGMAELTGSDFLGHPAQCIVRIEMTKDHPITRGVNNFEVRDEHYCLEVYAKDIDLFMTSTSDSEAGTQKAGYTRIMGNGRFCCLTPGHNYMVLAHPEFQKILKNALNWCAGVI
jgi:type 1 glutamine amidotransferase